MHSANTRLYSFAKEILEVANLIFRRVRKIAINDY